MMIEYVPLRTITRAVSTTALDLAAFGFSATEISNARAAQVTAYTNNIRYRYDGTAPITSGGHLLESNKGLVLYGRKAVSQLVVIAESGSPVVTISLSSATENIP